MSFGVAGLKCRAERRSEKNQCACSHILAQRHWYVFPMRNRVSARGRYRQHSAEIAHMGLLRPAVSNVWNLFVTDRAPRSSTLDGRAGF